MHRLDNHIRDIEPRIEAIYTYAPKQEEASLQESLSSFGWILLDSWIAWRTLRFVLKDADISQDVNEKWFQTPSSYTASQLKAIWRFRDEDLDYLKNKIDKNLKTLIDGTIQPKRNSSAHFTKSVSITGQDAQEIKMYYHALSKLFLLYEINAFLGVIADKLSKNGFRKISIRFENGSNYSLAQFVDSIDDVFKSIPFCMSFAKGDHKYFIDFTQSGCSTGKFEDDIKCTSGNVINKEHDRYDFFSNKGYYRNVDLFIETIEKCWITD